MKVSVYIPCFNAQKTVQRCLEAVLKQRYPLKEVIVVDDGSIDKTVEIASRYGVKIIRHGKNKGLAAARNTAIKNMNADFIASLDSDCAPEPDWLPRLMKRFNSHKVGGAGGRLSEAYSNTICDRWRLAHMKQDWGDKKASPDFLFGSNAVFRKEALLRAGLYNEKFKTNYEDVDICLRLKKKGLSLVYEPKAIAYHFKKDDVSSILNNYWNWNLAYYKKRGWYSDSEKFAAKIKDNIGLANRYIEEDLARGENKLLYLDFLLAIHHSLRDFEYLISKNNRNYSDYNSLSFWASLVDLTFFYHFNSEKNNLSTLIPRKSAFLQNFFALNLIFGNCICEKFKNKKFRKILYRDLLFSVYKIDSKVLLDRLLNLAELHQDWSGLLKKKHPNLDSLFLKSLFFNLRDWLEGLDYRFLNVIKMIEISAEKTNVLLSLKKKRGKK